MKLAVIVPSRGRPAAMSELLHTFDITCGGDTRIICRVDDEDPELDAYREAVTQHLFVGPRIGLGSSINEMAEHCWGRYDVIGFMGDDHRPRTPDWDVQIMEAIAANPFAVVYGDDLLQGRNLATQVFMSSQLVSRLGFFNPPGIQHMYLDNFWMSLGANLGTLTYLEDVVIEHMHPIAKKAEWDPGYLSVNNQYRYAADKAAYERYMVTQFEADLRRVMS